MSSNKPNDGGQAFPVGAHKDPEGGPDSYWSQHPQNGMSLRAYLAGEALRAFNVLANPEGYAVNMRWTPERIAQRCVEIADALIIELGKE